MAPSLVIALLAAQLAGQTLVVDPARSTVQFHVNHKLHKVDGAARTFEAKAAVAQDGKVMAMVRIPVNALDTGDANRDANMRDVLDVARYPFIIFKGIATVPALTPGTTADVELEGELDLHGVKHPLGVPAKLQVGADGSIRLRGSSTFSLDAFKIERPSLLLMKLEDDCRVELDVVMRAAKS